MEPGKIKYGDALSVGSLVIGPAGPFCVRKSQILVSPDGVQSRQSLTADCQSSKLNNDVIFVPVGHFSSILQLHSRIRLRDYTCIYTCIHVCLDGFQ